MTRARPFAGIRKVGILTGGGDCPGLNAVIRAASKTAFNRGIRMYGIEDGFDGLLRRKVRELRPHDVKGILHLGGTILGTTNRANPFRYPVEKRGRVVETDRSDEVVRNFRRLGLDALIAIGGDGTLGIAHALSRKGIPLVGVPKTIDNDIPATVITFGFDTAVSTATDALDKLHSTAESHKRVMVVELMGRYAGWIALNAGVAGGADVILIPEIPFDVDRVCDKVRERVRRGRDFSIVVVAEGAKEKGGALRTKGAKQAGREPLLGGIAEWLGKEIERRTGKESRSLVLGHLQRGGAPTSFDRTLATRFGGKAVELLLKGQYGKMGANHPPDLVPIPLGDVVGKIKTVPLDSDLVATARALGVSFGD
jgi:phosphofructokinase-like protein